MNAARQYSLVHLHRLAEVLDRAFTMGSCFVDIRRGMDQELSPADVQLLDASLLSGVGVTVTVQVHGGAIVSTASSATPASYFIQLTALQNRIHDLERQLSTARQSSLDHARERDQLGRYLKAMVLSHTEDESEHVVVDDEDMVAADGYRLDVATNQLTHDLHFKVAAK